MTLLSQTSNDFLSRPFSGVLIVVGFVIFVLIETLFSTTWQPFYYRFGLPLYRIRYRLKNEPPDMNTMMTTIDEQLIRSWWHRSIAFKVKGSNELFFNEGYVTWFLKERGNFFHGRMTVDREKQALTVTGYFNWAFTILPFLVFYIGLYDPFYFICSGIFFFAFFMGVLNQINQCRWVGKGIQNCFPSIPNEDDLTSLESVLFIILSTLILVICGLVALAFLFK